MFPTASLGEVPGCETVYVHASGRGAGRGHRGTGGGEDYHVGHSQEDENERGSEEGDYSQLPAQRGADESRHGEDIRRQDWGEASRFFGAQIWSKAHARETGEEWCSQREASGEGLRTGHDARDAFEYGGDSDDGNNNGSAARSGRNAENRGGGIRVCGNCGKRGHNKR